MGFAAGELSVCQPAQSKTVGLEVRDDFDFSGVRAPGQRGDLDGGAGGKISGEILRVNFIHAREIREVGEENRALDHVGEGQFLIVEDGLHVLQDAVGLRLDVASDEVAGGGIEGNLAGAEEQVADADGMVVRAVTAGADLAGLMMWF